MGRRRLTPEEGKSANIAMRLKPALLADLEALIEGRACNRTELVLGLLEAALRANMALAVIDEVERSKVRKLTDLSVDEVMTRLQAVENERTLLRAALTTLQTGSPNGEASTQQGDHGNG